MIDDDVFPTCPACDGPAAPVAANRGGLDWWCCASCTLMFDTPALEEAAAADPWDGADDW